MRRTCERIDIIDLGGEGRGTRKSENVFAIKTPVAIFVAWRNRKKDADEPAAVRYARIDGTREEKLEKLASVRSFTDLSWNDVPSEWQARFRPEIKGVFSRWPLLVDLFPWQYSGVQTKRPWPIAPSESVLELRWAELLSSDKKAQLMKESGDRTVGMAQKNFLPPYELMPPISTLPMGTPLHKIYRIGYRSFDRQFMIADNRLISRPRLPLWHAHSEKQVYLGSVFSIPLGSGPALTLCSDIPDLDFFRGSYGAKATIPLYRDREAQEPNVTPGFLDMLSKEFGKPVSAEDIAGYVYAVLAQPEYTSRFVLELNSREIRVPLTKKTSLFFRAAEFGKSLLWLHTYGQRLTGDGRPRGRIPTGETKCLKAVSDAEDRYPNEFRYDEDSRRLFVGDGVFGPVGPEVYHFEVSGFHVVKSWLGYRMKDRSGRKSSPLDEIRPRVWTREFTRELLELLWVLERTVEGYPKQKKLLEEILRGPLFLAKELPPVPPEAREAPRPPRKGSGKQGEFSFGMDDPEDTA